jgi:hypothetical protein
LRAALETGRSAFGFEISRDFCKRAWAEMLDVPVQYQLDLQAVANVKSVSEETQTTLFEMEDS